MAVQIYSKTKAIAFLAGVRSLFWVILTKRKTKGIMTRITKKGKNIIITIPVPLENEQSDRPCIEDYYVNSTRIDTTCDGVFNFRTGNWVNSSPPKRQ